jgi:hypothetical protein
MAAWAKVGPAGTSSVWCDNPRARKRSVFDALTDARWITDIKGALTLEVLAEYLELWEVLSNFSLQTEVEDVHAWQFSASGQYTTKSAYDALSIGATGFGPWKQIWKSWAPGKCKFFLWTAALNRIWTADHLARKVLSHSAACPPCDQVEETADHLLVACVFSVRSGLLHCKCSTCKPWLHRTIFPSLNGGWLLAIEWMGWLGKAWTPSLSWECGPSGSTATAAFSMGFHPMFLVLFLSSRKSCTSGPLMGLEECHISSP